MIKTESNREYHSNREYISKSRLAKMAVCPEYFKWCEENPEEPTEALTVGSAFHKIVLEPHDFDSEFVVSPLFDRRTKQGKADYEEFVAQSNGRQIITQEQYEMICQMREMSLCETNIARHFLKAEPNRAFTLRTNSQAKNANAVLTLTDR